MTVRIQKLDDCYMVVIDGRDERQFDFTKSSRSQARARAEAKQIAAEAEQVRRTLNIER